MVTGTEEEGPVPDRHRHWVTGEAEPEGKKVGILVDEYRLTPSEGMITFDDIRHDDLLSTMQIVKVRQGSNFLLSEQEGTSVPAL
jgi:hypothetical protein